MRELQRVAEERKKIRVYLMDMIQILYNSMEDQYIGPSNFRNGGPNFGIDQCEITFALLLLLV